MKDSFKKSYKTIISILLLFLLTLVVIFFNCYYHYKNIKGIELGSDKTTAHVLQIFLSEHQRADLALLESYANRPQLVNAIKEKNVDKILLDFTQLREGHEGVDWLWVTDRNGVLWGNYPVATVAYGKDLSFRDWYKGVRKEWKPYISAIFKLIVGDKELGVAVCVPVFDRKGEAIGILGNTQRISFLSDIVKQVPFDQYAKVTLIDQAGQIVYSNEYPQAKKVSMYPFLPQIRKAILEQKYVLEIDDSERGNRKNYAAIALLKDFGWTIIVERSDKDILLSGLSYYFQTTVIAILLFMVIVISFFYISRKQEQVALKEKRDELEQRVEERTEELGRINEALQKDITERKRAEDALQESEERFRLAFENANDGACLIDTDGNLIRVNNRMCDIFGYSQKALESMTINDIAHPEDKDISPKFIKKSISGEVESTVFEKRYLHNQGHIIWGQMSSSIIKNEKGDPLHFISHVQDITQRKQAEEALWKSEARFRQLFDEMKDGLAVYEAIDGGKDFVFKDLNVAGESISNVKKSEIIGKSLYEIRPNIDEFGLVDVLRRVFQTGKTEHHSEKFYEDEELQGWFDNYVYKLESGEVVALFADNTARRVAEEALKESEERFELAMKFANEGLYDWDLKTNEIYYSPGWKRLIGYEDEEIKNELSEWERLTKPVDVKASWTMLNEILDGKRDHFEQEFQMLHKDGHWIDILSRANVVFDEDGKGIRVLGTHVDITERRLAEESLREKEKKFSKTFHNSPYAITITRVQDGKFIEANDAFTSITGFTREETLSDSSIGLNLCVDFHFGLA